MFLDFYKLREQPFGVTPDPRYLYLSPAHREALAALFYGIETGRGFLSLVAEPGMGKTTLLFQLLKRWKGYVHSAFLFQTQCDSRELLRYLLEDLGLDSKGHDIVRMHSELNDFLLRETLAGKRVVVFIDEAQNLSEEVLETVRLLSDFEAPDRKLLQIVLAGQPELGQRLSQSGLSQLRQRIAVQARLSSLPPAEVVRYINHRLRVAGYGGSRLFTPDALGLIAERSRGVPRLINNLCFSALSLGCAMKRREITHDVVHEAAKDLSLGIDSPRPPSPRPKKSPGIGGHLRGSLEFTYSWIRENLFRRRLFQTSLVSLAACSLTVYFVVHRGSETAQNPSEIHRVFASSPKTPGSESAPAKTVADNSHAATDHQASQGSNREDPRAFFTYVVQPNDTLRELCMSTVGQYNRAVVAEIQKLNPELKDLSHLAPGQEIRFPVARIK